MKFVLLLVIALFSTTANAQFIKGSDLAQWADANDRIAAGRGLATDTWGAASLVSYTLGVVDSPGDLICIPAGVSSGQIVAMVTKYVRANPDKWNWHGSHIVLISLLDTFPCKKK